MRRRLLNLLTILSLLLCVAACVLWTRSYRWHDVREFTFRGVRWELRSRRGMLWLDNDPQIRLEWKQWTRRSIQLFDEETQFLESHQGGPGEGFGGLGALAARLESEEVRRVWDRHQAAIKAHHATPESTTAPVIRSLHFGVLAAPLAALPAVQFLRFRRRASRPKAYCCRQCGYDLTGNVSGVCPECGTSAEPPA